MALVVIHPSLKPVSSICIPTNVNIALGNNKKYKTIINPGEPVFMNPKTMRICHMAGRHLGVNSVGILGGSYLIIEDYDNRNHHKYNDFNLINQYNEIKLPENVPENYIATMAVSHNKPMRRTLHNSQMAIELEAIDDTTTDRLHAVIITTIDMSAENVKVSKRARSFVLTGFGELTVSTLHRVMKSAKSRGSSFVLNENRISITEGDYPSISGWIGLMKSNHGYDGKLPLKAVPFEPAMFADNMGDVHAYNKNCYLPEHLSYFTVEISGSQRLLTQSVTEATKHDRWWGLVKPSKSPKEVSEQLLFDLTHMIDTRLTNYDCVAMEAESKLSDNQKNCLQYVIPLDTINNMGYHNADMRDIDAQVIDLWDDTDLVDFINTYGPLESAKIKSRENANKIIQLVKVSSIRYPTSSRPVLTKLAFEEHRAVIGRLYSKLVLRKHTIPPPTLAMRCMNAIFVDKWQSAAAGFRDSVNILSFNHKATIGWLKTRPDCINIIKELEQLHENGFINHIDMSTMNVHMKLESILKEDPVMVMRQVQSRLIVWHRKAITTLFSVLFKEVKKRLKSLLKTNIQYIDGMRPDQISHYCRNFEAPEHVCMFSSDFSKMDRQTDMPLIDSEMIIYEHLGVHPDVIRMWKSSHENWKLRGKYIRGKRNAMRLSGQATTALGNAVVNMLCHTPLLEQLGGNLILCLWIGDDISIISRVNIDAAKFKKQMRVTMNQLSKPKVNNDVSELASFVIYKTQDGTFESSPNFRRMRRRYELFNSNVKVNEDIKHLRRMSYLMMVGSTTEVVKCCRDNNYPIEPTKWYSIQPAIQANANLWNTSVEEMESEYNQLLYNIINTEAIVHKFTLFTSTESRHKSREKAAWPN
jgi:hypothetical protein